MRKIIIGAATGVACVGIIFAAKKLADHFVKKIGNSYPMAPFEFDENEQAEETKETE